MQSVPAPEPNEEQIRLQAQLLNAVEQAILAVDLTAASSSGIVLPKRSMVDIGRGARP